MKIGYLSKTSVLLAVLVLILSSCNKNDYNQLTDDEMSTWGIYGAYQKLNFISTQGDLVPYKTGGLFRAYTNDGGYNEYLNTEIYLVGDTAPTPTGGLFLKKTSGGLTVSVGLPHFYENLPINNLPQTVQKVNGKNYNDVYILTANQFQVDSIYYIDSIFYSKSYGFLKYTDIYGETYTITQ